MAILAGLGFVYRHVFDLHPVFFQLSFPGARALVLYLAGDYGRAARAYRDHFRLVVKSGGRVSDATTDAILAGDLDEAERLARAHLQREPAALQPLIALGETALERGAFTDATAAFRQVLARAPENLDALMLASIAHGRAGDHGAAIDAANRMFRQPTVTARLTAFLGVMAATGDLSRRPAGQRPLCLLAHYHRYLRVFDTAHARVAARYAAQAVAAGDRIADAHVTIGVIHEKADRPDAALAAFSRAIAVDPKHVEAYRRSAIIYSERGDDARAYTMARAAFEAAPADPFHINTLDHIVMERLADPHQVVAIMGRALQVNPGNVRTHERLGYAYGFLGDQERSIEHYRAAIALEPRNPVHHEGLGWALDYLGRFDDAIAAYRQAVELSPRRYESHAFLAGAYHRRHTYREAIPEYEAAVLRGDPRIDTLASLCALYHTTSDFRRAVECFARVNERAPGHPLALRLGPESQNNLRLQQERR